MDQIDNLILQVKGRDELEQLNAALRKEGDALLELAQQLRTGAIAQAQFDAAARTSASEVLRLQQEIKALAGSGGIGGSGILGASYAVQDFVTVLQGGQGLERALMSVSNNVPGLAAMFGAGAGIAGQVSLAFTAITALIPVVKSMWDAFADEAQAQAVKERLREITREIREAHKAFQALQHAPTDYERASAESIREYLRDRPNADTLREGLIGSIGEKSAVASMTAEQREEYDRVGKDIIPRNEVLFPDQAAKKNAAIARRAALVREAKGNMAELLMGQMGEAGPAGDAARGEIFRRMGESPELFDAGLRRHLNELSPDALRDQDKEYEESVAEGERAHEAAQGRNRRRAIEKRKEADRHLRQKAATDAHLRDNARQIKDEERAAEQDARETDRELERSNREWQREGPMRKARGAVRAAAAGMGFQGPSAPNDAEAEQMAHEMIANMRAGLGAQAAAQQAVLQQIRRMAQAMAEWREAQSRMFMSTDHSGQFPVGGGGL